MIGNNIKKYRLLSGISQKELGEKLNVSSDIIKMYEEEFMVPDSECLIEIAKLFKIKVADLFETYDLSLTKLKDRN